MHMVLQSLTLRELDINAAGHDADIHIEDSLVILSLRWHRSCVWTVVCVRPGHSGAWRRYSD